MAHLWKSLLTVGTLALTSISPNGQSPFSLDNLVDPIPAINQVLRPKNITLTEAKKITSPYSSSNISILVHDRSSSDVRFGSGFYVNQEGIFITANHIVNESDNPDMTLYTLSFSSDNKPELHKSHILKRFVEYDVAFGKTDSPIKHHVAESKLSSRVPNLGDVLIGCYLEYPSLKNHDLKITPISPIISRYESPAAGLNLSYSKEKNTLEIELKSEKLDYTCIGRAGDSLWKSKYYDDSPGIILKDVVLGKITALEAFPALIKSEKGNSGSAVRNYLGEVEAIIIGKDMSGRLAFLVPARISRILLLQYEREKNIKKEQF